MNDPDWLSTEKLVKLIEKSISPDSIVEHNVYLLDLTSLNNKKRQCDIVITTGTKNRQTRTIVEVQNRKSKFNITFFHGLLQKMKDVGAQHLICVSTIGFSKTIIEKVRLLGGTVRLITLTKHDTSNLPIDFVQLIVNQYSSGYYLDELPKITFFENSGELIPLAEIRFIVSALPDKEFEISELAQRFVELLKPQKSGIYIMSFPNVDSTLKIRYNDRFFDVQKFSWNINIEVTKHEIPIEAYSYDQLDSGSIAWVLEGRTKINGKNKLIRMPVVSGPHNTFSINKITISK